MQGRALSSVLIVDDDEHLLGALRMAFLAQGYEVLGAATIEDAILCLGKQVPDLVITDVRLPDGSGLDVVRAALKRAPMPIVIAISGEATPAEAFQVAEAGARAYVEKPVSFARLLAEVEQASSSAPRLDPFVKAQLGHVDMKALNEGLRLELVREAMARCGGNVTQAAKLLHVTRQAVQQALRRSSESTDG
jgi:two-component system, response regulator RegA